MGIYPDIHIAFHLFAKHCTHSVKRFRETGSIEQKKSTRRLASVVTEQAVHNVEERMQHSPNKSIRRLSQQTGVLRKSSNNLKKKKLHMIQGDYGSTSTPPKL